MLFETLSSITNKEAPATPTIKPRGKWYSGTALGMPWTLFFGAMAGAAVGVLNLRALANEWKLEAVFELLDAPAIAFMNYARDKLDWPALVPNVSGLEQLTVILYWTLIGLFIASFICLSRHRNYRRVMLFGAGGGLLVGCLNWLAIVNHWYKLWVSFTFLGRPVRPAKEAISLWINGHFRVGDPVPYVALTYIVYWFVIGLLLASLFCVARMLVKRKAAK
jgi:hypothetical protein